MKEKYLLVKSNRGAGLGDSLRVVIAGITYAYITGRLLVVDWRDGMFGPEGVDMFREFFTLNSSISRLDLPSYMLSSMSVNPPIWEDRLTDYSHVIYMEQGWAEYDRLRTKNLMSCDLCDLNHPEDILVLTDFTGLPGILESPEILSQVSSLIKPAETVENAVHECARERFDAKVLGIHIRQSSEPGAELKSRSDKSYLKVIASFLAKYPSLRLFLSTDNKEVLRRFIGYYPDLIYRTKPLPAAGEPIHLSEFGATKREKTFDAVIDMLLLARCHYLVYPSNSSFSIVAALLSGASKNDIVPLHPESGKGSFKMAARNMLRLLRS